MFWNHEKKTSESDEMLENMKRDIQTQLGSRGVMVSGVNILISPDNLCISIYINGSKRFA